MNPAASGQGGKYGNQLRRFEGLPPEVMLQLFTESAKGLRRQRAAEIARAQLERRRALRQKALDRPRKTRRKFKRRALRVRKNGGNFPLRESGQPVGPRTYEIHINADPAHMLTGIRR